MPWARARVRVLLARASFAHDYGAGGAALFDIVNVQNWTRRRISGPLKHARFRTGSGAALLLSIFRAGLAHREEHSPCKREAGGSSPPASTTRTQGRNRPVAGHRFGKAVTGVRSAVAAPSMHSWRNGRRSRLRSGRPRGMEVQVLPGVPTHCSLRQAAKASVPHTDIPRFESWSEHQPLR